MNQTGLAERVGGSSKVCAAQCLSARSSWFAQVVCNLVCKTFNWEDDAQSFGLCRALFR
jgi:hypothetical protein